MSMVIDSNAVECAIILSLCMKEPWRSSIEKGRVRSAHFSVLPLSHSLVPLVLWPPIVISPGAKSPPAKVLSIRCSRSLAA